MIFSTTTVRCKHLLPLTIAIFLMGFALIDKVEINVQLELSISISLAINIISNLLRKGGEKTRIA